MNSLLLSLLVIMVIFTFFHFYSDMTNFLNTDGKFAEGFTDSTKWTDFSGVDISGDEGKFCVKRKGYKQFTNKSLEECKAECVSGEGLKGDCNSMSWNKKEKTCTTYTGCSALGVDANYDTYWPQEQTPQPSSQQQSRREQTSSSPPVVDEFRQSVRDIKSARKNVGGTRAESPAPFKKPRVDEQEKGPTTMNDDMTDSNQDSCISPEQLSMGVRLLNMFKGFPDSTCVNNKALTQLGKISGPDLILAYGAAGADLKKAEPHLKNALEKADPHLKNALTKSAPYADSIFSKVISGSNVSGSNVAGSNASGSNVAGK